VEEGRGKEPAAVSGLEEGEVEEGLERLSQEVG